MEEDNNKLSNKIISGSFWIMALEISNQVLQFVKTFYSAKILTPKDFGIVGFAFLVIAFIDILSTTGMKEAIIQRKNDAELYLDTIWIIEVSKGLIVLLLSIFLSPLIIRLIDPENSALVQNVVMFIGAVFFIQCSTSLGVVEFEKQIQFNKYFVYQFSGTFVDVVVSMSLVYYYENVWGLFFGIISGQFTRVLFSYLLTSYRPKFDFCFAKAKELFHFGKWIFLGRVYNFLGLQADSIMVTSFFSLYQLGIYQMASRIGNLPMNQVSNIIGRLAFPTFSKVQDDLNKLKHFFLLSINVLAVMLTPLVILVFSFIEEFTSIFLGSKWVEITPIVKVLILSGMLRIFISIVDSLFCAVGKPKYSSRLQLIRFLVFISFAFILGYYFKILGIAFSGLISIAITLVIFFVKASKHLDIKLNEVFQNLLLPVLFGVVVSTVISLIKLVFHADNVFLFFMIICFSLVLYFGSGFIVGKLTRLNLFGKTIDLISSYKKKR